MAATRNELARRLAALTGFAYARRLRRAPPPGDAPTYFVPSDTLRTARRPRAQVSGAKATYSGVSCPIPSSPPRRSRTPCWTCLPACRSAGPREFPRRVADVVLKGASAFAKADALSAGNTLLVQGPVRVKPRRGHRRAGPIRRRQRDRSWPLRSKRSTPKRWPDPAWSSSRICPTSPPTASARFAWRTRSPPITARSP